MLIMDYWRNGPPPDDNPTLARILAISETEWKPIRLAVQPFFTIENGHWRHGRIDEEFTRASDKQRNFEIRAQKAVAARKAQQQDAQQVEQQDQQQVGDVTFTSTFTSTSTSTKEKRGASRFSPPSVDEVKAYCADRKNKVNPETFVDFYAAKGWKVGNQPMKDWKAAVRTWEKREQFSGKPNGNGSVPPITDERGLESYGAKFGIRPRAGESWQQFRSRVVEAAK